MYYIQLYVYKSDIIFVWYYLSMETTHDEDEEEILIVKDAHGNVLANGDSVTLIKDLKVKGSSITIKQGTKVQKIRLTDDPELIECNADKVKGLVLRTEFIKKA